MALMNHYETCGICHTTVCAHTLKMSSILVEPPCTPGSARGCPLDVTEDPDLFDYSNEGDALIIEEVGNAK